MDTVHEMHSGLSVCFVCEMASVHLIHDVSYSDGINLVNSKFVGFQELILHFRKYDVGFACDVFGNIVFKLNANINISKPFNNFYTI